MNMPANPLAPGASVALAADSEPRTTRCRTRALPRGLVGMFLVLLALTFVLRFPAFFVPVFNSDETFLATQAHVIRDGGQLYEDAADRKPPVVPYVYAATFAFFGTSALWSVRIVAMVAVALTALLLAVEARRRYGERAGWIAGLMFVGAMVAFAPQDGQAANFEVFMILPMVASIICARRGKGAAAGALIALSMMAKQTGAGTLLPVLYLMARARGKRGVGAVALGFSIPTALVALAVGPAQLVYWAVLGNGSYVGVDTASAAVFTSFALMTFGWVACNVALLWKLPHAWHDRRVRADDGHTDTDLWLWLVSAVISVAIGFRFFGHYYMQLVPPITLLAAGALSRSSWRTAKLTLVGAACCAAIFSAGGYFIAPVFGGEPKYEHVSSYLAANARSHDTILVWGSAPEIYWASGLRPATRFITTNTFLAGNHPGRTQTTAPASDIDPQMWEYFYEDFRAHPPQYILDTSPAKVRGAEHSPISDFPTFNAIVDREYHFVRSIDGISIYERQTSGQGVDR
ncbi:MAG: glycosyltransferase family 39 protein [Acidimicrobiia bacterium]